MAKDDKKIKMQPGVLYHILEKAGIQKNSGEYGAAVDHATLQAMNDGIGVLKKTYTQVYDKIKKHLPKDVDENNLPNLSLDQVENMPLKEGNEPYVVPFAKKGLVIPIKHINEKGSAEEYYQSLVEFFSWDDQKKWIFPSEQRLNDAQKGIVERFDQLSDEIRNGTKLDTDKSHITYDNLNDAFDVQSHRKEFDDILSELDKLGVYIYNLNYNKYKIDIDETPERHQEYVTLTVHDEITGISYDGNTNNFWDGSNIEISGSYRVYYVTTEEHLNCHLKVDLGLNLDFPDRQRLKRIFVNRNHTRQDYGEYPHLELIFNFDNKIAEYLEVSKLGELFEKYIWIYNIGDWISLIPRNEGLSVRSIFNNADIPKIPETWTEENSKLAYLHGKWAFGIKEEPF